jgi:hypothetical protein
VKFGENSTVIDLKSFLMLCLLDVFLLVSVD